MASIPVCMAPDPNTRVPKYRPPPGACDAHCHIFGPRRSIPVRAGPQLYAAGRAARTFRGAAEDAGLVARRARQRELPRRGQHGDLGCDRAERRPLSRCRERRRELHRSRLRRSCTTAAFAASASTSSSIWAARPTWASSSELVARAAAFGWHVVLHFDAADLLEFDSMLRTLPVPFIIDHMGRVPTKDGLDQEPFKRLLNAARMDNCWVKICGAERISSKGPPFTDAVPFAQAILDVARGSCALGHGLAAPEHQEAHAERRRSRRPDPAVHAGRLRCSAKCSSTTRSGSTAFRAEPLHELEPLRQNAAVPCADAYRGSMIGARAAWGRMHDS